MFLRMVVGEMMLAVELVEKGCLSQLPPVL